MRNSMTARLTAKMYKVIQGYVLLRTLITIYYFIKVRDSDAYQFNMSDTDKDLQ